MELDIIIKLQGAFPTFFFYKPATEHWHSCRIAEGDSAGLDKVKWIEPRIKLGIRPLSSSHDGNRSAECM